MYTLLSWVLLHLISY